MRAEGRGGGGEGDTGRGEEGGGQEEEPEGDGRKPRGPGLRPEGLHRRRGFGRRGRQLVRALPCVCFRQGGGNQKVPSSCGKWASSRPPTGRRSPLRATVAARRAARGSSPLGITVPTMAFGASEFHQKHFSPGQHTQHFSQEKLGSQRSRTGDWAELLLCNPDWGAVQGECGQDKGKDKGLLSRSRATDMAQARERGGGV